MPELATDSPKIALGLAAAKPVLVLAVRRPLVAYEAINLTLKLEPLRG